MEEINKVDKPLAKLTKKKSEKAQVNKIRNEKGEVTTVTIDIQRRIRDYYRQLYVNKMDNLEEMDKFLKRYNLPRLNQEDSKYEPPIISTEVAIVTLKRQQTTVQDFHR